MDELRNESQPASQEDIDFADGLLKRGKPPEDVRDELVSRGLTEDNAGIVVYNRIQGMRALVAGMLREGLPMAAVLRGLKDQGFTEAAAVALVQGVTKAPVHGGQRAGGSAGLLAMGLGGVVFVLGVGLFIGNVTGLFRTIPMAGWLTMLIGGAIYGWGSRHNS
jgi:hypothetical protein